jgi:hypothetical protein
MTQSSQCYELHAEDAVIDEVQNEGKDHSILCCSWGTILQSWFDSHHILFLDCALRATGPEDSVRDCSVESIRKDALPALQIGVLV